MHEFDLTKLCDVIHKKLRNKHSVTLIHQSHDSCPMDRFDESFHSCPIDGSDESNDWTNIYSLL